MFVQFHVYALPPERHTLRLQPKTLLERMFASQLNRPTSPQYTLPGQSMRSAQGARGLSSPVYDACSARDCAVGAHFATRNFRNQPQQTTLRVRCRFFRFALSHYFVRLPRGKFVPVTYNFKFV